MSKIIDRIFELHWKDRGFHARVEAYNGEHCRLQILLNSSNESDSYSLKFWDGDAPDPRVDEPIPPQDLADAVQAGRPLTPRLLEKLGLSHLQAELAHTTIQTTAKIDDLETSWANMWLIHLSTPHAGGPAGYWLSLKFKKDAAQACGAATFERHVDDGVVAEAIRESKSPLRAAMELHARDIEPLLSKVDFELMALHDSQELGKTVKESHRDPLDAATLSALAAGRNLRLFKGR